MRQGYINKLSGNQRHELAKAEWLLEELGSGRKAAQLRARVARSKNYARFRAHIFHMVRKFDAIALARHVHVTEEHVARELS